MSLVSGQVIGHAACHDAVVLQQCCHCILSEPAALAMQGSPPATACMMTLHLHRPSNNVRLLAAIRLEKPAVGFFWGGGAGHSQTLLGSHVALL